MFENGTTYNFTLGRSIKEINASSSPGGNPILAKIVWVENPYIRYEILTNGIFQEYSPVVNDSYAFKTGIFNVTYGNIMGTGDPVLTSGLEVRWNDTSRLTDMEDSLNGLYRLETHILFFGMGYGYNATAPNLLGGHIWGDFGPVFCRLRFVNASIHDFYTENTTPINYTDKYNVVENITYIFFSRQNWYYKTITIFNGYIAKIEIYDKNEYLKSPTQVVYSEKYNRFNVSSYEGGSLFQFFSWYDDPEQPPQTTGNEYVPKGNAMGLPYGYGSKNIDTFECTYMYWTANSLGRSGTDALAYIIETKEYMNNATLYTKQGSYFVNANISEDIKYLYDGMFGVIGLELPQPIMIDPGEAASFSVVMGVENELYLRDIALALGFEWAEINFDEYIDYLIDVFYHMPDVMKGFDKEQFIQARDNNLYIWAYKIAPDDPGSTVYVNITASFSVTCDQVEIPYFDIMNISTDTGEYTVYVYKPVITGTYNVTAKSGTTFGEITYSSLRTIQTEDLHGGNISIGMPICDHIFEIAYSSEVSSEAFTYPGYVELTLRNSSYINLTDEKITEPLQQGQVFMKDIPFGNYSVYFNITQEIMGADIDEQKDIVISWYTKCYEKVVADLGKLCVRVMDMNNDAVSPADVYVDNGGIRSPIKSTDLGGYTEIIDIPLYNRTGNVYIINVSYLSPEFNVVVYNDTVSYRQYGYSLSMTITLELYRLDIHVVTYDGSDVDRFGIKYKHAGMDWKQSYSTGPIYTFPQVPSSMYISQLELNISHWISIWGVEVYNYTIIDGLTKNTFIDILLPMYSHVRIDIYDHYLGTDRHIDYIYQVNISLERTGISYMFYDVIGSIDVSDAPYGENFTLNVTIQTEYHFLVSNSTTITIDNESLSLRMFYLTYISIYAYPEYNQSMKLTGFSFAITANQIFVGTIFAEERGIAVLDEFPMPSLYNLTPFKIDVGGNVRGVDILTNYVANLSDVQDGFSIGIPLNISKLTINIYDTLNRLVGADIELIYLSGSSPIIVLKEHIDDGVGTFDLIPQGSYSIKFLHFSIWGMIIVDIFEKNITDRVQEESFVLSVSMYTVETKNLLGDSLDGVFVELYIIAGGQIIDYNILGTSTRGVVVFDDMPTENAYILVNGSRYVLENILANATFRISTLEITGGTYLNLTSSTTTLFMSLGVVEVYFSYISVDGETNIAIESGVIRVEPLQLGPPIISMELSNNENVLLYNVPVGYYVNLICEYQTPYGLQATTKTKIMFNESYTNYTFRLGLSDLIVYATGHDGMLIPNATVSLIVSATTIYEYTNEYGYATFRRLPAMLPGSIQVTLRGEMETIASDYVDITTGVNTTVYVSIGAINLVVGIANVEGELLHSVILHIEREYTTLSLTPNASGYIPVGILAYGEYRVTIYFKENTAILPTNFTDAFLMISPDTPRILYLTATLGEIIYDISAPESGYQNSEIEIMVRIADVDGRAISGLDVVAKVAKVTREGGGTQYTYRANEREPGIYRFSISTRDMPHGSYVFSIYIETLDQELELGSVTVYIHSQVPRVTLGLQEYIYLGLGVLLFTMFVSIVYYRLMKEMRVELGKGVGRLEKIYWILLGFTIVALIFAGVAPSEYGVLILDPGIDIMILVALLVLSIALYGVLIYIDAVKSFLAGRFQRSRLIINVVMYLLPLLILKYILDLCNYIEWTKEYVLENLASWGPIVAPALAISFMTAYLSVYTVLIINSYRDIKIAATKIAVFREKEVPEEIIERETRLQLRRISSGIRIKMLVFLGLLGLSAFSTVPVFQNVAFIIIAIPIALLIIGPYISQVIIGVILGRKEY